MKCIECGLYNKSTKICNKWKAKITNANTETDCKFFRVDVPRKQHKASESAVRPGCEKRTKGREELIGGLVYTQPYWYDDYKPYRKKKSQIKKGKKK